MQSVGYTYSISYTIILKANEALLRTCTAYQIGLRDVLYNRRRYGWQAGPNTSPREDMAQQGTMGHAHISCLLKDNGCRLQHRHCMHATQIDGAVTVPAKKQSNVT